MQDGFYSTLQGYNHMSCLMHVDVCFFNLILANSLAWWELPPFSANGHRTVLSAGQKSYISSACWGTTTIAESPFFEKGTASRMHLVSTRTGFSQIVYMKEETCFQTLITEKVRSPIWKWFHTSATTFKSSTLASTTSFLETMKRLLCTAATAEYTASVVPSSFWTFCFIFFDAGFGSTRQTWYTGILAGVFKCCNSWCKTSCNKDNSQFFEVSKRLLAKFLQSLCFLSCVQQLKSMLWCFNIGPKWSAKWHLGIQDVVPWASLKDSRCWTIHCSSSRWWTVTPRAMLCKLSSTEQSFKKLTQHFFRSSPAVSHTNKRIYTLNAVRALRVSDPEHFNGPSPFRELKTSRGAPPRNWAGHVKLLVKELRSSRSNPWTDILYSSSPISILAMPWTR